jgi:uncharacterized protein (DUF2062 family)
MTQPPLAENCPAPKKSFWRRRLVEPLMGQLKQGATPEKLSDSLAWGAMIGVFPIIGVSSFICGFAALALKLNHIAIQAINWVVYPVQLLLIIPFLRLGNIIFRHEQFTFSLIDITGMFADDFAGASRDLGGLALRGIAAWIIVALPGVLLLRRIFLPPIRHLAVKVFPKSTHL